MNIVEAKLKPEGLGKTVSEAVTLCPIRVWMSMAPILLLFCVMAWKINPKERNRKCNSEDWGKMC